MCVLACVCAREACARGQSALVMKPDQRCLKKSESAQTLTSFSTCSKLFHSFVSYSTPTRPLRSTRHLKAESILSNWMVCVVAAGEASISDWPVYGQEFSH